MKYFVISDTHQNHEKIKLPKEHVDIVFHCGDFCQIDFNLSFDHPEQIKKNKEQIEDFMTWFSGIDADYHVCIPGNHELVNDRYIGMVAWAKGVRFIHDETIEICGFKIYGNGGYKAISEGFGNHGYFVNEGHWGSIPDSTEVLITHTPTDKPELGGHIEYGCEELRQKLLELKNLKLHLCGHIHEGRGEYQAGNIKIINAACEMSPIVREITKENK